MSIELYNLDCYDYLKMIKDNSIDLILVDPPYNISHKSGFTNTVVDKYKKLETKYGDWDVLLDFDRLFKEYRRVLKKGGTLIIWYAEWKMQSITHWAKKHKFKQPRLGFWLKCNPVPINSKINYLTNGYECFCTFVKHSKPTFNSAHDNAVYHYPILHGKERLKHTTQKPLFIIEDMIKKHSNEGDLVLDSFYGSGTTADACNRLNRNFTGTDSSEEYYLMAKKRVLDE